MANGQLPGRVAPTSIGQGKSYSQMMNEQIGLIQKQRAANLDKRLAQEEKNRQFRTEQLQNIYDFDVSGLASGDVQVLADVQRQLAASLDPNSENSYSDSQQLVADIALINNAYNEMKRWADSGGQGRQIYQNGLLQPERGDGTVVVADEDMLNSRNEVWEKGAFAEGSVRLVGPPGNRQLVGMALDVDGNEIGEVNFFENSMRNQPDQFWRQEVVPAAPYAATLTERALTDERLDGRNTREIAEIDFAVMNEAKKNRFREELYERIKGPDGKAFEEIKPEEYSKFGIDDDALINEMVTDYNKGLEARPGTAGADAFDFNKSVINMPQLSKPVKLRSEDEEFAGTIEGAQFQQGLDLDTLQKAPNGAPLIPVEVAYVQSNGTTVKKILDPATNPVEYDAFMEAIGRRGKEQLLQYSGYYQTPQGPQVDVGEDPQNLNPAVDRAIREDLGLADADASPGAKLESDRQMLLDDIADAEEELKLQMSLAGGNAGNLTGRMEAMERLVELQEQLGPINDALEELGIERIEYEPIDVSAADAGGAGAGGADPDASTAQADPATTGTADTESRPLQTEPGGVYTSAQLEQNLESWEKELLAGTRPDQTVKSDVAVKAKNFGNLRPNTANPYRSGVYEVSPAEYDDDGNLVKPANQYQNFATYDDGLKGLIWDIKSKQHLDGLSSRQVADGAEIIEVMKKYAPASDRNNPEGYTNHIVNFVNERLGLTGEEAFTSKSPASDLPTELLVEAIISKEDISLYKEMKDRGYFEGDKISGIAGNVNAETSREMRREISRA